MLPVLYSTIASSEFLRTEIREKEGQLYYSIVLYSTWISSVEEVTYLIISRLVYVPSSYSMSKEQDVGRYVDWTLYNINRIDTSTGTREVYLYAYWFLIVQLEEQTECKNREVPKGKVPKVSSKINSKG